jgi:hypothetical protein
MLLMMVCAIIECYPHVCVWCYVSVHRGMRQCAREWKALGALVVQLAAKQQAVSSVCRTKRRAKFCMMALDESVLSVETVRIPYYI